MPTHGQPLPERQFSARADLRTTGNCFNDIEPVVIGEDLAGRDVHPDSQAARQQAWETYKNKLAGKIAVREATPDVTKYFPISGFHSWQEVYEGTTYVATRTEIPKQIARLVLVDQNEKTA